ncbi:MAG: tetratricopeptide repeat protein [candidate division Zixibacteria bacterium]|nr:tetratricopeptide repeat protein [candidate division Zixibacteria bacterium]
MMFGLSLTYVIGFALLLAVVMVVFALLTRRGRRKVDDQALYVQALQALLDGDQTGAFYKLKEVVSQNSENIDAYLRLGMILAERNNVDSAIRVHSELLLRSGLKADQVKAIRTCLIDDYIRDRQNDRAIELLTSEYERDVRDRQMGEKLLDLLIANEEWEQAEQVAERLYKQDHRTYQSRFADVKIKLADQLHQEGKSKKARSLYKAAYDLDQSKAEAWVKTGESYLAEKRPEDAVKSWRYLAETYPRSAHLVLDRLEKTLFDLGQFNALGGILEKILEQEPDNIEAAMALGNLYAKKGNYERAEEYYRQIIEVKPGYTPATVGLAAIYRQQGKTDEALDTLEKLLSGKEIAVKEA